MTTYPIYLDYNATTPCDPQVVEEMLPYFSADFGNAASKSHAYGWVAEEAVELARERVAALVGAEPREIIFTSGATESINLAIQGIVEAYAVKGNHVITCVTEHKAVLDVCGYLETKGIQVTRLAVDRTGLPDLDELRKAITKETILMTLMYANNETGVILPVTEIGAIALEHNIPFFCDATQAVGKIAVDVKSDNLPVMAFSAHKIYGPKGVGVLYQRRRDPRIRIIARQYGGGHERNLRSGTLNVPGIVGLGKACALLMQEREEEMTRLQRLRNKLVEGIPDLPGVAWNGKGAPLLPHVANISFDFTGGDQMLKRLTRDLAVSSGSACTSATVEPSFVLRAMGLSDEAANASIRFSLGRFTTDEQITKAVAVIRSACQELIQ